MEKADTILVDSEADARQGKRLVRHPQEKKFAVAREAGQSGVSLAKVALRHGLNVNMVRTWVVAYRTGKLDGSVPATMLPVVVSKPSAADRFKLPAKPSAASRQIEVVLARGVIRLTDPTDPTKLRDGSCIPEGSLRERVKAWWT